MRGTDTMRYSQIKPDAVESGHFRYHLGQLVKDGYVEQVERGIYGLTNEGQQLLDTLSEHKVIPERMPKVITYTLLVDGDDVLLQTKRKQPYVGLLNMVGGKLHKNETSSAASLREVQEKTGVTIGDTTLRGVFEILIRSDGKPFSHVIAYCFTAKASAADFDPGVIEQVAVTDLPSRQDLAPDFLPVFRKIYGSTESTIEVIEVTS